MLLVSTYELGHQPLGLAVPARALAESGHEVRCADLAVEPLRSDDVDWADAVAVSVPMHTATRLARRVLADVRARRPHLPTCLYGLYAAIGAADADPPVDLAVAGEHLPELVAWAGRLGGEQPTHPPAPPPGAVVVRLGRDRQPVPARDGLPPLASYARVVVGGEERLAGYVEASRGCAHRCRHCPVPVVYDGRTRLVDIPGLLADVQALVDMGARHVTFGDPDFLNGPHHARRVVDAVHGSFPDLTFDATVKVEHILRHRSLWPAMASSGLLFVTTAVESADAKVLDRLAKGHTVAEAVEAVAVLRQAGIEPRPTFVPFTPWTDADGIAAILGFVARCDLQGNVDPIQLGIRLLVPPGSLLLADPDLQASLDGYDADACTWRWRSRDPRLDALAGELASLAEQAGAESWPAPQAHQAARDLVARRLAMPEIAVAPPVDAELRSHLPDGERPRLTEAWFCCAEPTQDQWAGAGTGTSCGGRG